MFDFELYSESCRAKKKESVEGERWRERTTDDEKLRERQPELLGNQSTEEQRGRSYTPPAACVCVCLRRLDCLREEWWWWC